MARLHIDIENLREELDIALTLLARGGQVVLERHGAVVAEMVPPGTGARAPRPLDHTMPEHVAPVADFFSDPDAMAMGMSLLRAQAGVELPNELWDELSREEAMLEMLSQEME